MMIGRQLGKSTLMRQILQNQADLLQNDIDQEILKMFGILNNDFRICKSWRDGQGRKMYRVAVSSTILDWLETNYDQKGAANPEWWKFDGKINITDQLLTILSLKWT